MNNYKNLISGLILAIASFSLILNFSLKEKNETKKFSLIETKTGLIKGFKEIPLTSFFCLVGTGDNEKSMKSPSCMPYVENMVKVEDHMINLMNYIMEDNHCSTEFKFKLGKSVGDMGELILLLHGNVRVRQTELQLVMDSFSEVIESIDYDRCYALDIQL